ncbi:acyl-CoA dehydrogenase family protein [Cupriavidus sp. YAF13]|uniref:acyl-CoA dehydrogenase family protein n=1 Tax=Cupriavidus sp. YAF13 TaxID=3233075 RepID=UPI003F8E2A41
MTELTELTELTAVADLTEERRMMQESVRRYVERSYGFAQRSAALAEPAGLAAQHWSDFAGFGWLALGLPEACGGFGSALDQAALAEELGRALVAEPWLANAALCGPLLVQDADEVQCGHVAAMAEGRLKLALAAREIQGRYDAFDITATAQPEAQGWLLDGRKTLVLAGGAADLFLVLARTAGKRRDRHGLSLFAVPANTAGLSVDALPTYDGRQTAALTLRGVVVPAPALIGARDTAWPRVEAAIDHATTMACAESVGTMARAFALTRDYLATREQFGRAITANQVIRHRLVDLFVSIEQARAITESAAARLQDAPRERMRVVSHAKAFVSAAGRKLGEEAVQLHGAVGMTDEMEIGRVW